MAASLQCMSASAQPVGHIETGRDPPWRVRLHLRSHRCRSGDAGEREAVASCFGRYSCLRLFNVADVLRPAIKRQPAPSKPVIPLNTVNSIAQIFGKCKENRMQLAVDQAGNTWSRRVSSFLFFDIHRNLSGLSVLSTLHLLPTEDFCHSILL